MLIGRKNSAQILSQVFKVEFYKASAFPAIYYSCILRVCFIGLVINLNHDNSGKNRCILFVFVAGFLVNLNYLAEFRRQKSLGNVALDKMENYKLRENVNYIPTLRIELNAKR